MGSKTRVALAFMVASCLALAAQSQTSPAIPAGSKVFIAPMPNGFDTYLKSAFEKKRVPLVIVHDREEADFEITGHSESHKPGLAKTLILGRWRTDEQASIHLASRETGEVVFAYSVNKQNSAHGRRSTAEACAKHLKNTITSRK
jgi:hypothetical protein